jgi:hypothetical protein
VKFLIQVHLGAVHQRVAKLVQRESQTASSQRNSSSSEGATMPATLERLQKRRKISNSSSKRSSSKRSSSKRSDSSSKRSDSSSKRSNTSSKCNYSTPMQLSPHDHPSQALLYLGSLLLLLLVQRRVDLGALEQARSKSSPGKHLRIDSLCMMYCNYPHNVVGFHPATLGEQKIVLRRKSDL